jgi:hypothetical protein
MELIEAVILLVVAVALVAMICRQAVTRSVELLSYRNIFIIGFIQFQVVSGIATLGFGIYDDLYLDSPGTTGAIFIVCLVLFLLLFNFSYSRGWFSPRLALRPPPSQELSSSGVVIMSLMALGLGVLFRFFGTQIPIVGPLFGQASAGLLILTGGCAGWLLAERSGGLLVGLISSAVAAVSVALLLVDSFGRRDLVGLLIAFVWGVFHGARQRQGSIAKLVATYALLLSIAAVGFLLFTASRGNRDKSSTILQAVESMSQVDGYDLYIATLDSVSGQCAAANSMWAIEHYPKDFEYRPLNSIWYFVTMSVPRQFWPDKPTPLAELMVWQGGITRVAKEYNLGPGLIGHVFAELPWLAMIVYPALLGALFRYLDIRVTTCLNSPSIIIPLGCGFGQILAVSRGELGLFMYQAVIGVAACMLLATFARSTLGVEVTD